MLCLAAGMALLSACSGNDYVNAIPSGSTALISIDMQQVAANHHLGDKEGVLKSVFHVDDMKDCGIDVSEKIYLFETADGNLGLCAKVADEGDLESWMDRLTKEKICSKVTERKGFHFAVLKDAWLIGFSDKALLVMGPVVADAQAELQRQMVRYLNADEEHGLKGSPMFDRLDSIASPMAMVAQAQALPEKFVAPFTLGAPKDADASQVVIAADMNVKNGILSIHGETFSFNREVNEALKNAVANYRPIKGSYVKSMPADALAGIFMNVDGNKFLPMMRSNRGIQQLLLGINAAIDMDNILRSVDGDMSIIIPSLSDKNLDMTLAAKLAHSKWLEDVGYWKKSCPAGSKIVDWGKNRYYYTDGKTSFFFGVTEDGQFLGGSDAASAMRSVQPSPHPISSELQKEIIGQKLAMVVNFSQSGKDKTMGAVSAFLSPIFGQLNSIVYTLK